MIITSHLFGAYLKCPTKCWLRSSSEMTAGATRAQHMQAQNEPYLAAGISRLRSKLDQLDCVDSPSVHLLKRGNWRLATNVLAQTPQLESTVHAVECVPSKGPGKRIQFIPIRFVPANKLSKDDKLLLAFDSLALSATLGRDVKQAKIIHGEKQAALNVRTSAPIVEVREQVARIDELLSGARRPDLVLIPHCVECEFQSACRQQAMEKDDLSLLSGMTEKERKKLHAKGIFTVTQLSYTFRPRRRSKRIGNKREKYQHSLRALAIREKKIYIAGHPELEVEGTRVYLDVEGLPDRESYYLIGLRIENGDSAVEHSLWANKLEDEEVIWREFINILTKIDNPVLIHYGNYETIFLKRMCARYGTPSAKSVTGMAIKKSINLVAVIYSQVYFPTFSNGLKDIGHFLGVTWSGPVTSGFQSLAYRFAWEQSFSPELKTALLAYNREDCSATQAVCSHLIKIIREAKSRVDIELSNTPKKVASAKSAELHQSFDSLLRSAHFAYDRSKIKLSPEKIARQTQSLGKELRRQRSPRRSLTAIKGRIVRVPRRRVCPIHSGQKLRPSERISQHPLIDLAFSKNGCHKTVVRYKGAMGYCSLCNEHLVPPSIRALKNQRFGWGFQAWAIYQRIAMRMSYRLISKAAFDIFSEQLSLQTLAGWIEKAAEKYRRAEDLLLRKLLSGPVLHLDETRISILGDNQYVWVFTDDARVVFRLRPNRETDFLKLLLANFRGTIVTDFYGGYDTLPCRQQKCLVHLIRDLNDDLWKNPFDGEFERFVAAFNDLLRPILEDARKFGLKARYLRKHRRNVDRFYRDLITAQPQADDTMARYRKRFERYKDSLFCFLENDAVPWHNNAAERALRHLAVQRKISGAFSESGASVYLRFLSIAQTCRFQQKSFLGFLLSGSTDVDEYKERNRVHPDWATDAWEKE